MVDFNIFYYIQVSIIKGRNFLGVSSPVQGGASVGVGVEYHITRPLENNKMFLGSITVGVPALSVLLYCNAGFLPPHCPPVRLLYNLYVIRASLTPPPPEKEMILLK